MNTNLLDFVLGNLDRRKPKWAEVSRCTGVPYDTLKKIATRTTPNPGVRHIQKLADYYTSQDALGVGNPARLNSAQPATENVAHGAADPTTDHETHRTGAVRRHDARRENDPLNAAVGRREAFSVIKGANVEQDATENAANGVANA